MYKLIIQDDEGKTTVVPLIRDEITIGRKEGNTIRLTERNVSRKHARILRSNGTVLLEDLDSYNGVRVNGSRIQGRVSVAEADRIQIGDYLLELKLDRGSYDVPDENRTQPMERLDDADDPADLASADTLSGTENGASPDSAKSPEPPDLPEEPSEAAPPMEPMQPARLVVVSANLAGREHVLDKPSMVIGRTEDNDIVINHRSISRHHAKIVFEHGRYAVLDQQSSNGVRVNGEEYGKVELRRGDLIDLGHVRLRFVEPGEDFDYSRDTGGLAGGLQASKRGAMIAAALVLVGGGVAVAWLWSGAGKRAPAAAPGALAEVSPPSHAPSGRPAPDPSSGTQAGVAPTPPVGPAEDDAAKHVVEARQAAVEERWEDAMASARLAKKLEPGHEEASRIEDQARREFRSKVTYENLHAALSSGKLDDATKLFRAFPDDSFYRVKAAPELERARAEWVQERVQEARALVDAGKCEKIPSLSRKAAALVPEARDAIEQVAARCSSVANESSRANTATRPAPVKEPPTVNPPPEPSAAFDFDALLEEANTAAKNGYYSRALAKAEVALELKPADSQALSIAGMSACKLKHAEKATKFIGRLKGQRQQMVRQICLQSGVSP
ncbi:MAG: FHA domain-containing protein [Deltaproteobacteria bacterium]|nr:FHA domain-containing protein [Deltaproteobacteria bacterium]